MLRAKIRPPLLPLGLMEPKASTAGNTGWRGGGGGGQQLRRLTIALRAAEGGWRGRAPLVVVAGKSGKVSKVKARKVRAEVDASSGNGNMALSEDLERARNGTPSASLFADSGDNFTDVAASRFSYDGFPEGYDALGVSEWGLSARMEEQLRTVARSTMENPEFTLFYTKHTKHLAKKIASEAQHIKLGKITWKAFDDGFPNVFIENANELRNKHVAFLASFHNPQVIFEQLSVIYALPRMFVASFTLVLPFFPTGTMERVEDEGEVATAASMARVLSCIPLSRGGPTTLMIYDIHALQERFYFGDNVVPFFQSAIPILKERLEELGGAAQISIAYPDEGAWKRFHREFNDYDQVVCTKVRDGDKRIVRLKEGDCRGRHVVIVDDLVQSGGTLMECQKVLAENGAAHVSAFVTHGVFPNQSYEKFSPEVKGDPSSGFAHFWITDSCPQTVPNVQNRKPFEVLSLASSVANCLRL